MTEMSRAHLAKATDWQAEANRLAKIIVEAKTALQDGRRGDCLKMLCHALPGERPAYVGGGGGRAA